MNVDQIHNHITPLSMRTAVAALLCCFGCQCLLAQSSSDSTSARVYFEYQVERPVSLARGSESQPTYPPSLKSAGVEGTVLAQFVVDTSGVAEKQSFKVLKSPNPQFVAAVELYLTKVRFVAAAIGSRKVRQLVQQRFVFSLPKQ